MPPAWVQPLPLILAACSLATHNLAQLLASCFTVGLLGPDLMYGLLDRRVERFHEDDVSLLVRECPQ